MAILKIPADEFGQHLRDGYACLAGSSNVSTGGYHNVTAFDNSSGADVTHQLPNSVDCTDGFGWFIVFILFVVATKAAFAVVMISGSASKVWVAATAAVPLAQLLFFVTKATREDRHHWAYDLLGPVTLCCTHSTTR
jgi:hypothetical protein